jgi:uncharacterized protein YgiM (DUF1202 family)
MMAKCLYDPEQAAQYPTVLGTTATALINSKKAQTRAAAPPEFSISDQSTATTSGRSRKRHQPISEKAAYVLSSKDAAYLIELTRSNNSNWIISGAKQTVGAKDNTLASNELTNDSQTKSSTSPDKVDGVANLITQQKAEIANADQSKDTGKAKNEKPKSVAMLQSSDNTESAAQPSESNANKSTQSQSSENQTGVAASVANQVDSAQVRVRSGPSPTYRQIATIARGAKITVIGKNSGWYKIKVNGQQGFIYGGLVDYKTPDAYETITVRKAGGLTDDHEHVVGSSRPGDRLVVLGGAKEGKMRVQLASGQTAYINKDAVDVSSDTPQFVP